MTSGDNYRAKAALRQKRFRERRKEGKSTKVKSNVTKSGKRAEVFNPRHGHRPENLENARFNMAWCEWCDHRKEKKKPLTPTSVRKQIAFLSGLGLEKAIETINHTIFRDWIGLREPDENQRNNAKGPGPDRNRGTASHAGNDYSAAVK